MVIDLKLEDKALSTLLMVHHLMLACQLFEDGFDDDGEAARKLITDEMPPGFREAAFAFNETLVNYYNSLSAESDNDN